MKLSIKDKIKLNNGIEIPYLGLGTYEIRGTKDVENAISSALDAGYRLIDTAAAYRNEKEIGKVLKKSGVPREEIFLTTKLDNSDHGYDEALRAFDKSLKELYMDYIDLYLIHWPISGKRKESWKALEKIYDEGKSRAIGVSNYTIRHLKELFEYASIIPAVNQIEFNPFVYEKELLNFCNQNNIQVEAYTPLTRGNKFNHPVIKELSEKYFKTSSQIFLRWGLQHNLVIIPKSSNRERIFENADIFNFEISDEDMKKLNLPDGRQAH